MTSNIKNQSGLDVHHPNSRENPGSIYVGGDQTCLLVVRQVDEFWAFPLNDDFILNGVEVQNAIDAVCSRTGCSCVKIEGIFAPSSLENIDPQSPGQFVVAPSANEHIVSETTLDYIVTLTPEKNLVPSAPDEEIPLARTKKNIFFKIKHLSPSFLMSRINPSAPKVKEICA